ncbi:MAG: aminotransferase class III-fold pyridoxal phosphate-dependent enzyme [Candidatus Saganbacteria bacterium]|nr:aminotransferase class III-fold pyridoxal phosphate-dependent enzyme [Candidatus Saganbacteria bacterium]
MFLPDQWPAYYDKAKGCEIWDLDGKKYVDMSYMGIGACVLGYADDDVNRAVKEAADKGSMSTLNCPEEVELAELLCELHPWAGMVRYARTGGEAMSVAVRIARARSGKDLVLFCGYHGWHDWYLSANLADNMSLDGHLLPGLNPLGVPRGLKGTTLPFKYNDTEGFLQQVKQNQGKIGTIVLETIRNHEPRPEFIEAVKRTATDQRIVLVLDEITAGWRLNLGGAHLKYAFDPDIAVFGKAISNGFPMAAIIGKKDVMEVAQDSFISSTYWTDRIGPVAGIATIKKLSKNNVPEHLIRIGKKVRDGWKEAADRHGLKIEIAGIDPLVHFDFKHKEPMVLKTLFTQVMLEKGFLATTAFYASYAHKDDHIAAYLKAAEEAFAFIGRAIAEGAPEKLLKGPVCHSGFKRLT